MLRSLQRAMRWVAVGLLLNVACLLGAQPMGADAKIRASQVELEAVYLFNFAKFVRWPGTAGDGSFDICVAGGTGTLSDALRRTVSGEAINGHSIRMRMVEKVEDESGCDILFLDGSMKDPSAMLEGVSGKPVLTVSDAPEFLEHGGMLQFVMVESRVRFSVNLLPARRSGLGLSAELLKVALRVQGAGAGGGQ